jgi:mono/diheme cytochrome c family protein
MKRSFVLLAVSALAAAGADPALIERGKKEEARACVACHSLRLNHSQRLSRGAWNRVLDKMVGWGTVIKDREALLEYLATNFGDDRPPPAPVMTRDGTAR